MDHPPRSADAAEVWPEEKLGLERFQHIHNAVFKRIDDRDRCLREKPQLWLKIREPAWLEGE